MTDRRIAIMLLDDRMLSEVRNTVQVFMANSACSEIAVFSEQEIPEFNIAHERTECISRLIPRKDGNETAKRNAVLKLYEEEGYGGILHVVSDCVKLLKDPSGFMDDLESMMRQFDYPLWLSTVTDPCNYVYNKYNPRVLLKNDMPELVKAGMKYGLALTSHSNTAWMAYDMTALRGQPEMKYFSEDFTVAMYYIVELLARRRRLKKPDQPFFMNQYLTVDSEDGVFLQAPPLQPVKQTTQQTMQEEDLKFKQMNIDYAPDMNIDTTLDALIEKIISKVLPTVSEKNE